MSWVQEIKQLQRCSEERNSLQIPQQQRMTIKYAANNSVPANMVLVTPSTIPEYLRSSELYLNLCEGLSEHEENEEILLPTMYYKIDESVMSQNDLVHLCHTLRYWGVSELPQAIIDAAFGTTEECVLNWADIADEFGAELSYLYDIQRIRKCSFYKRIEASIELGSHALIILLHGQGCEITEACFVAAAHRGSLTILKCLHEISGLWYKEVT